MPKDRADLRPIFSEAGRLVAEVLADHPDFPTDVFDLALADLVIQVDGRTLTIGWRRAGEYVLPLVAAKVQRTVLEASGLEFVRIRRTGSVQ